MRNRLFVIFFLFSTYVFAQNGKYSAYYQTNYNSARENFINKSKQIIKEHPNAHLFSFKVPSKIDDDLTINALFIPSPKTERLLVLSSGIHGIEGFVGSAIQTMFLDKLLTDSLLETTGILFLHSMNPYGFKYLRRVTENNVDLNRNSSTKDSLYKTVNESYSKVNSFINPTNKVDVSKCSNRCFFLRSMNLIRKQSIPVLRQAILQGQYQFPEGLYFGGKNFEPQIKSLKPFMDSICKPYKLVMEIDLHTGYGKRGVLHLFPNPVPENVKKLVDTMYLGYHIDWGDNKDFYVVSGDFINYMGEINQNKKYIPMTFEYGTLNSQTTTGSIESLHRMVMENEGFHYGYKSSSDSLKVNKKFIEMYFPSSEKWREQIMQETIEMFQTILPRFETMK